MKLRCDACRFYEFEDTMGHCHFMPPSQFRDVRNDMWTPFPVVHPDWWCAQHEARPVDSKVSDTLSPQAAGGLARIAARAPERRTEIARTAAEARWNGPDPEDDF
jgi:hypothetical protein